MVGNISRLNTFLSCPEKAYNTDILHLRPRRDDDSLIFGGGVHKGLEVYFTTGYRQEATTSAERLVKARYESGLTLPEEVPLIEKYAQQSRSATTAVLDYLSEYQGIQILMPEVRFCVKLPDTLHHCHFAHNLLHPNTPYIHEFADRFEDCHIPHYLAGKTDAVVRWNNMIWLLEFKTSSDFAEGYFIQWQIHKQPTAYVYGIQKETGLPVHGFILIKIEKPRKNAKDPFHYHVTAEPIPIGPDSLSFFERDIIKVMNAYEEQMFDESKRYRNEQACRSYNRTCMFHSMCKNLRGPEEGEFRTADSDYVTLYLKQKCGLLTRDQVQEELRRQEEALYAHSD